VVRDLVPLVYEGAQLVKGVPKAPLALLAAIDNGSV
jgi:hypothetical protein